MQPAISTERPATEAWVAAPSINSRPQKTISGHTLSSTASIHPIRTAASPPAALYSIKLETCMARRNGGATTPTAPCTKSFRKSRWERRFLTVTVSGRERRSFTFTLERAKAERNAERQNYQSTDQRERLPGGCT